MIFSGLKPSLHLTLMIRKLDRLEQLALPFLIFGHEHGSVGIKNRYVHNMYMILPLISATTELKLGTCYIEYILCT